MQSTLGQVQSASTPTKKTAATTAITLHNHQQLKLKGKRRVGEKKEILYYSKPKKYNEKCSVSAFVFRTS